MPAVKQWSRFPLLAALCAAVLVPAAAHADPSISSVFPSSAPLNSIVTIYGSDFQVAQGMNYVLLGGRFLPIIAWSDRAIHVLINPLAFNPTLVALDTTYDLQVITFSGSTKKTSNSVPFTLTSAAPTVFPPGPAAPGLSDQPVFQSFQRADHVFCIGQDIAFEGSGFGFTQGMGYVTVTGLVEPDAGETETVRDHDEITQTFAVPVLAWSENAINTALVFPTGTNPVPGTWTMKVFRMTGSTSFKTATSTFTLGVRDASGACVAAS